MRRHPLAMAALFLAFACGPQEQYQAAQDAHEESEHDMATIAARIDEVWNRYEQALVAGDLAAWTNLHTPDVLVSTANTPDINGREELRPFVTEFMSGMRVTEVTMNREELDATEDAAWELGTFSQSFVTARGDTVTERGRYFAVLQNQADGTWQIHRLVAHNTEPVRAMAAGRQP